MIAEEEALNKPLTWRFDRNVEDACPMKPTLAITRPFDVSTVNTLELAAFNTRKALAEFTQV